MLWFMVSRTVPSLFLTCRHYYNKKGPIPGAFSEGEYPPTSTSRFFPSSRHLSEPAVGGPRIITHRHPGLVIREQGCSESNIADSHEGGVAWY
jgi:hypothetical protein